MSSFYTVFGLMDNVGTAPSVMTIIEGERRNLTIGYIKGTPPAFFTFNVLVVGSGGNASKLHSLARYL